MNHSSPRPLPVANSAPALEDMGASCSTALAEPELRTSNGVDGFRYSRIKGMLYVFKLLLAAPMFPFLPFFIAAEAKDPSIARNYFGTQWYVLRTLYVHLRFGSFKRLLKYNFLYTPEQVKARIDQRRGACTRCAKCCKQYDCIFLGQDSETKEHYCKVYQTSYWYYGTCGRYPLDQQDIDDHACPGFSFEENPAA